MKRLVLICLWIGFAMGSVFAQRYYQPKHRNNRSSYSNNRSTSSTGSSLGLTVNPGYSHLLYRQAEARSTGAFDLGFGLHYRYQFHPNWAITIGVNKRAYRGKIDLNGVHDSLHLVEEANEKYYLHQVFNSTETQKLTYVEPMLQVEFVQNLSPAVDLTIGLGAAYGIWLSEKNTMDGTYKKYAYFYENHNLIDELPSMNLGTYNAFLNPLPGTTFKGTLLARLHLGFRFRLTPNWFILAGLSGEYGLLTIQRKRDVFNHHESYSGVVSSAIKGAVHPISFGIEVGVAYRFGKYRNQGSSNTYRAPSSRSNKSGYPKSYRSKSRYRR